MADLKLLTERVVEKEKTTIRQNVEDKRITAEDEIQAAQSQAEQDKQRRQKEIDENLQQQYVIRKNTLETKQRDEILRSKQEVLTRVVSDAKEQLKNSDKDTLQDFVAGVLKQFEGEGNVNVLIGEYSEKFIDQEWMNTQSFSNLQLTLNEEPVKGQAGIVVQKEGVEYNFLFNELVDDITPDVLSIMSEELFN